MLGRPVAPDLAPKHVVVPDVPTYGSDDPTLRDEQQVARTEILMTKGVRDRRQLMALLEVEDTRTMDRYIKRVYARWELLGANRDFARHRGEGLNRLDLIESETWSKISNAEHPGIALMALKLVTEVQRQRLELLGLTPKVIAELTSQAGDNIQFSKRIATHDTLSRVASRMMSMIEERTGPRRVTASVEPGPVEAVPSDDPE
jgi:hypothetical protein